jgi:folate-binding protein YgfZ
LKLYRLRSKVELTLTTPALILSLPPVNGRGENEGKADGYADPRHSALGRRSLIKPNLDERPFSAWDSLRIRLAVPDGSRDMVPEQSTLIESNIDRLHGVAFDKGCYIGQELTARMHHRGLAKKHLFAVEWKEEPSKPGTDIMLDGYLAGQARSNCGPIGLTLLKDGAIDLPGLPFTFLPS